MDIEELRERNAQLEEEKKQLTARVETLTADINERDTRIKDLEDYNRKLFMQLDFDKKEDDDIDEEQKLFDDIINNFKDKKY